MVKSQMGAPKSSGHLLVLVRAIGVEHLTVLRRTVDLQDILGGDHIDKPPVHAIGEPAIGHLAFRQGTARLFLSLPDGPIDGGLAILDTPAGDLPFAACLVSIGEARWRVGRPVSPAMRASPAWVTSWLDVFWLS